MWLSILVITVFGVSSNGVSQPALDVESVTITVSDLDEIVPFYTEVLPFRESGRFTLNRKTVAALYGTGSKSSIVSFVELKLGDELIYLQEFEMIDGRKIPADSRSNDLWFQHIAIVVSDMEEAYAGLRNHDVTHVSTFPQTLPETIPAAAGIKAFYFRDPDGHNLELIWFPEDKGNPRWQQQTNDLYLGIDHTAIAVSNTDHQKEFYDELLGLDVMGSSENFGTEQEHLNQVFGARLDITGLAAESGMGVEFLEYVTPPGGRPYPQTSRPSDLWHWHTTVVVDDIEQVFQAALGTYDILSTEIVNLESSPLPYQSGFILRDADGHAVLVVQH
ncbi:MAG: glyoxalase [Bacteroidetes bacterium]|nr:glyoxalase [Bacteroidota bacterium]